VDIRNVKPTMRVAMYYNNRDVRLEELPTPRIGPGEVLVKIKASGICGSDLMEWYRLPRAPRVLGHEIGGEIVEIGPGVTRYRVGDRVTASHHVPCNTCYYCLNGYPTSCDTLRTTSFDPGGFSEFVRLPAINVDRGVYRIPEDVSDEEATFTEPLACVLRGQQRAGFRPGQSVMVIGSGIAGILHINLARALGARRVVATDINEYRLQAAQRFGADAAIPAREDVLTLLREANAGMLADLVIVCTGAPQAIIQSFQCVERGGTILLFAPTEPGTVIPFSINDVLWGKDVSITTTYAGSPADHVTALELIRARRVQVREMITHRLGLAETGLGFQLVEKARDSLKVIIEPWR
jgi:L-iditol 2-dehydrogenase